MNAADASNAAAAPNAADAVARWSRAWAGAGDAEARRGALAALERLPAGTPLGAEARADGAWLLRLPARRPAFSLGARADVVLDASGGQPETVATAAATFAHACIRVGADAASTARDLVLLLPPPATSAEGSAAAASTAGGQGGDPFQTAAIVLAAGGAELASSRGLPLALVEHGQRSSLRLRLECEGEDAATCLARALPTLLAGDPAPDPDPAVAAMCADAAAIHDAAAGLWSAGLRLGTSRDPAAQALGLDGPLRAFWQRRAARVVALEGAGERASATVALTWALADEVAHDGGVRPRTWAQTIRDVEAVATRARCRLGHAVERAEAGQRSPRQGPLQAALLQALHAPIPGSEPVAPLLVLGAFGRAGLGWRQDTVPCLGCLGLSHPRVEAVVWALLTEG